jgi:hypothetical protein
MVASAAPLLRALAETVASPPPSCTLAGTSSRAVLVGTSSGPTPAGTSTGAPSPPPPCSRATPLLYRSYRRRPTSPRRAASYPLQDLDVRRHPTPPLRVVVLLSPRGESVPSEAGSPSPTSLVQQPRNFVAMALGHRGPPRHRPPAAMATHALGSSPRVWPRRRPPAEVACPIRGRLRLSAVLLSASKSRGGAQRRARGCQPHAWQHLPKTRWSTL